MSEAYHTEMSGAEGTGDTAYIEYESSKPIGHVLVRAADDPDFSMDDLSFGPIYVP